MTPYSISKPSITRLTVRRFLRCDTEVLTNHTEEEIMMLLTLKNLHNVSGNKMHFCMEHKFPLKLLVALNVVAKRVRGNGDGFRES